MTEPGQREYEAWHAWLRGPREQEPQEKWACLDAAARAYWAAVEKENGRSN